MTDEKIEILGRFIKLAKKCLNMIEGVIRDNPPDPDGEILAGIESVVESMREFPITIVET